MKEFKVDKIMASANEYLKQRNFELNASVKTEIGEIDDSQISAEEQVGLKEIISPSSPNAFTFSTASSHYSFIDQQYIRLKSWMTEASEPCRSELSQVLFPLFVHLYLELLTGAGKPAAKFFFNRHHQVFRVNRDYEHTLRQVWSAAGETTNSPIMQTLKSGKYLVRLSELTLNYFLRYLQTSGNPTLLQIFNNYIEVELSELSGSTSFALFKGPADLEMNGSDCSENSTNSHQDFSHMDCSSLEEMNQIQEIMSSVRNLRPSMPSLSVYSVINANNGLTCAKINNEANFLSCGFEDSVIKLWRLTPPPQNIGIGIKARSEPWAPETILFCDKSKLEEETRTSILEKEEEEETKNIGGRHTSGGELCSLRGHRGPVFDVAFTHCSSYLFSVGEDAGMRLWDLHERRVIALYQGHHYPIWCLDVSPHTIYVATGSYDETARLWTPECTFPLRTFVGHTSSVDCVSFHPNCSYIASGSSDRSIRLWQVNDGSVARILLPPQSSSSSIKTLSFSPNGKYLASGTEAGEVVIWDLTAGKVLCQLSSSSEGSSSPETPTSWLLMDPVVSLGWSKDSRLLFSATSDGSVRGNYFDHSSDISDLSEVGNVFCGSTNGSQTLVHTSLNNQNYLCAVVVVYGER